MCCLSAQGSLVHAGCIRNHTFCQKVCHNVRQLCDLIPKGIFYRFACLFNGFAVRDEGMILPIRHDHRRQPLLRILHRPEHLAVFLITFPSPFLFHLHGKQRPSAVFHHLCCTHDILLYLDLLFPIIFQIFGQSFFKFFGCLRCDGNQ